VLWVVLVVAAPAELWAEQTLTAPAAAAMMIAALNNFVNFIYVVFLFWLYPSRIELRSSCGETASKKESAQADFEAPVMTWRSR
jgi:hypothetical protein